MKSRKLFLPTRRLRGLRRQGIRAPVVLLLVVLGHRFFVSFIGFVVVIGFDPRTGVFIRYASISSRVARIAAKKSEQLLPFKEDRNGRPLSACTEQNIKIICDALRICQSRHKARALANIDYRQTFLWWMRQSGEPYITVQQLVRRAEAEFERRQTMIVNVKAATQPQFAAWPLWRSCHDMASKMLAGPGADRDDWVAQVGKYLLPWLARGPTEPDRDFAARVRADMSKKGR